MFELLVICHSTCPSRTWLHVAVSATPITTTEKTTYIHAEVFDDSNGFRMMNSKLVIFLGSAALGACHSATQLNTIPDQAEVHRDNTIICMTPCEIESRMPWFAPSIKLHLERAGFEPRDVLLRRNDVYVARVIFFPFFWPWAVGLEPTRIEKLSPLKPDVQATPLAPSIRPDTTIKGEVARRVQSPPVL
ncbi:hypothetical protein [Methylotetracoccus oryzae]|uniref:hypothetical protein n=1 Tax=Methylotetracoccus oryzae TaxID=1919059 RepID=UPI00111910FE|nr:hypothetical protein [Methylotetracoccus oryzae]